MINEFAEINIFDKYWLINASKLTTSFLITIMIGVLLYIYIRKFEEKVRMFSTGLNWFIRFTLVIICVIRICIFIFHSLCYVVDIDENTTMNLYERKVDNHEFFGDDFCLTDSYVIKTNYDNTFSIYRKKSGEYVKTHYIDYTPDWIEGHLMTRISKVFDIGDDRIFFFITDEITGIATPIFYDLRTFEIDEYPGYTDLGVWDLSYCFGKLDDMLTLKTTRNSSDEYYIVDEISKTINKLEVEKVDVTNIEYFRIYRYEEVIDSKHGRIKVYDVDDTGYLYSKVSNEFEERLYYSEYMMD